MTTPLSCGTDDRRTGERPGFDGQTQLDFGHEAGVGGPPAGTPTGVADPPAGAPPGTLADAAPADPGAVAVPVAGAAPAPGAVPLAGAVPVAGATAPPAGAAFLAFGSSGRNFSGGTSCQANSM